MVFKVGMMKVYDHISWNFLNFVMVKRVLIPNGGNGSGVCIALLVSQCLSLDHLKVDKIRRPFITSLFHCGEEILEQDD